MPVTVKPVQSFASYPADLVDGVERVLCWCLCVCGKCGCIRAHTNTEGYTGIRRVYGLAKFRGHTLGVPVVGIAKNIVVEDWASFAQNPILHGVSL